MITSTIPGIQASLDFLISYLPSHSLLKAAWIFGSVAEGRETEESDIDIAILCDNYDEFVDNSTAKGNWWSHLELGCKVHIDYVVSDDVKNFNHLDNWESAVKIYER